MQMYFQDKFFNELLEKSARRILEEFRKNILEEFQKECPEGEKPHWGTNLNKETSTGTLKINFRK